MAAANAERKAAYQREVDGFLACKETSELHLNDGMNYHHARPPTESTARLIDNLKERLDIALKVQNKIRGPGEGPSVMVGDQDIRSFRFDLMQLTVFLFADLRNLRRFETLSRAMLLESIRTTEAFLAIFLQRQSLQTQPPPSLLPQATQQRDTAEGDSFQPNAGSNQTNVTSVGRDDKERNKAFRRDNGACVFSQYIEPEVTHIWPFAINDKMKSLENTRTMLLRHVLLMSSSMRTQLETLFTGSSDELGVSDKTWNMITMNRIAHNYWTKAYFGLEWHSVVGTEMLPVDGEMVQHTNFLVQWHWVPRKVLDALSSQLKPRRGNAVPARRFVDLDTPDSIKSIAETISAVIENPPIQHSTEKATLRDSDGRLIETGRLFMLKVETKDYVKTKAVIDAQFLAIRMASFSGAGESIDDLDRTCPPDLFAVTLGDNLPQIEATTPDVEEE